MTVFPKHVLMLQSIWGGVLDPIADKVFIGCIAGGLTLQGLFPTTLLCIFLGRDIFLITLGALFRAIERPSGAPFFDSDTATFEIIPTKLSKVSLEILSTPTAEYSCLKSSCFR